MHSTAGQATQQPLLHSPATHADRPAWRLAASDRHAGLLTHHPARPCQTLQHKPNQQTVIPPRSVAQVMQVGLRHVSIMASSRNAQAACLGPLPASATVGGVCFAGPAAAQVELHGCGFQPAVPSCAAFNHSIPRCSTHPVPPQDLPLSKLRGFGGKLGEQLEAMGCTTAGQVRARHASRALHAPRGTMMRCETAPNAHAGRPTALGLTRGVSEFDCSISHMLSTTLCDWSAGAAADARHAGGALWGGAGGGHRGSGECCNTVQHSAAQQPSNRPGCALPCCSLMRGMRAGRMRAHAAALHWHHQCMAPRLDPPATLQWFARTHCCCFWQGVNLLIFRTLAGARREPRGGAGEGAAQVHAGCQVSRLTETVSTCTCRACTVTHAQAHAYAHAVFYAVSTGRGRAFCCCWAWQLMSHRASDPRPCRLPSKARLFHAAVQRTCSHSHSRQYACSTTRPSLAGPPASLPTSTALCSANWQVVQPYLRPACAGRMVQGSGTGGRSSGCDCMCAWLAWPGLFGGQRQRRK